MSRLKKFASILTIFTLAVGVTVLLVPQAAWASANPCNVRCLSNGLYLDCTWGGSSDPRFCCWTNPWVGCQSYWCQTGVPISTKFYC